MVVVQALSVSVFYGTAGLDQFVVGDEGRVWS